MVVVAPFPDMLRTAGPADPPLRKLLESAYEGTEGSHGIGQTGRDVEADVDMVRHHHVRVKGDFGKVRRRLAEGLLRDFAEGGMDHFSIANLAEQREPRLGGDGCENRGAARVVVSGETTMVRTISGGGRKHGMDTSRPVATPQGSRCRTPLPCSEAPSCSEALGPRDQLMMIRVRTTALLPAPFSR